MLRLATAALIAGPAVVMVSPADADDQTRGGGINRVLYEKGTTTLGVFDLKSAIPDQAPPTTQPVANGTQEGAYSPDGTRIAYFRVSDRTIQVLNRSTNTLTKAATFPAGASLGVFLRWSPDSTKLAYNMRHPVAGQSFPAEEVWTLTLGVTNSATPGLRLSTANGQANSPTWSPDSQGVAYSETLGGQNDLYFKYSNGTGPLQITNDAPTQSFPSWSPNGDRIAYISADPTAGTRTLKVTGMFNAGFGWSVGGTGAITPATSRIVSPTSPISWSPNSLRLAVNWTSTGIALYTTPPFGSGNWQETFNGEKSGQNALLWSPDNLKVAYQPLGKNELWTMNAGGSANPFKFANEVGFLLSWH
ncbi:TolB family protein [Thermomonospora umbrina]|uniref:TolB family protein n=1 Tax=Thermomonospora umbrina TaxID=111806 RepID=UPI000E23514A|nr:PD40 domain-containing protein [Thermomonospora umbrina]